MITALIIALCVILVLIMPIVIKCRLQLKGLLLQGQVKLYWAFVPVTRLQSSLGVLPLKYESQLFLLGIKIRQSRVSQLQNQGTAKKKMSSKSIRILASAFRTRRLRAELNFGLTQDPALTALGYGLIQGTVQAAFSWIAKRSAADCQAEIYADFQQTRLDGCFDGIFQTTLAQIIVSVIKAWRS